MLGDTDFNEMELKFFTQNNAPYCLLVFTQENWTEYN